MPTLINKITKADNALANLQKGWFILLILQALLLIVGTVILRAWWVDQYAIRWVGLAGLASLFFLATLWGSLRLNHRPGEDRPLPGFGYGNLLTIMRGLTLTLLIGFLFSPWPTGWVAWLPGGLYSIVAIADLFDGYLARKFDYQTTLGERLDLSLDGLGLLVACILLFQYGQVPAWYLLVGLARYLFVAGIWLRNKLGKPVYDLTPNFTRRPFAGAQMGFVAFALYPVFGPPGIVLAAALFAVPFLVGFSIDWFGVSGTIPLNLLGSAGRKVQDQPSDRRFGHYLATWLPLSFRISLVVLIIIWIVNNLLGPIIMEYLTAPFHISDASSYNPWLNRLFLIFGVGTLMIALGAAGRIAAIIVLIGIGMYVNNFGLNIAEVLLAVGAAALLYLGTGPYSLWNPEHQLINRRLGEL